MGRFEIIDPRHRYLWDGAGKVLGADPKAATPLVDGLGVDTLCPPGWRWR